MQLKINDKSNQFWILDFGLPRLRYFDAALLYERLRPKRSYAAGFTATLRTSSVQVGTSRSVKRFWIMELKIFIFRRFIDLKQYKLFQFGIIYKNLYELDLSQYREIKRTNANHLDINLVITDTSKSNYRKTSATLTFKQH